VNNQYIYVCDNDNHRVQILTKENGSFYSKWGTGVGGHNLGQFYYPYAIYFYKFDEVFYVGDEHSVQMFKKDTEECLQRLGDIKKGGHMSQFSMILGICIVDENLCVSDYYNRRIQIFKRSMD